MKRGQTKRGHDTRWNESNGGAEGFKVTVSVSELANETEPEQAPLKIKCCSARTSQNSSSGGTGSCSPKYDHGSDGQGIKPPNCKEATAATHQQQHRTRNRNRWPTAYNFTRKKKTRQNGRHSIAFNEKDNDKVRVGRKGADPSNLPYLYKRYPAY